MKSMTIFGLVALLALTTAAYAYPSLAGPTGAIALPTADVVPAGGFPLAVDYYDSETATNFVARALFGVANSWEFGGLLGFGDETVWGVNAKYRLDDLGLPGFAAGIIYNAQTDEPDLTATEIYAVYTRRLSPGGARPFLRWSLGANWLDAESDLADESSFRVFGSLEGSFSRQWSAAAELQMEGDVFDADPLSSVVVRYAIDPRWTAQAGFTNASPILVTAGSEHNWFFGVAYNYGNIVEDEEFPSAVSPEYVEPTPPATETPVCPPTAPASPETTQPVPPTTTQPEPPAAVSPSETEPTPEPTPEPEPTPAPEPAPEPPASF